MDFSINLAPFVNFFYQSDNVILWKIFIWFGWMPIVYALISGGYRKWLLLRQSKWSGGIKRVILAIDVPKNIVQTPKAVENMFTYFGGLLDAIRPMERYWEGQYQLSMSLEIVSIEGYIQFLIRTPEKFRELVETAIYSQYPEAEITEVNDYTEGMPTKFPDDEYDVYGHEFMHAANYLYPIKTYAEFEHQISDTEVQFKDPMAALMDFFSNIGEGEQYWFQIIIIPEGFEWPKLGDIEIKKILKEKKYTDKNVGDKAIDKILKWMDIISEWIYKLWGDIEEEEHTPLKMLELNPIEKKKAEGIAMKTSKLGFQVKIRFVYIAKKEVFNKTKAISGSFAYMRQFADMHLNGLKPDTKFTMTRKGHLYFLHNMRLNWKKNNIMRYYIGRSQTPGVRRGILNIEELATLWHFPSEQAVKAPLLQRVASKKSEPPAELPVSEELEINQRIAELEEAEIDLDEARNKAEKLNVSKVPDNLPVG